MEGLGNCLAEQFVKLVRKTGTRPRHRSMFTVQAEQQIQFQQQQQTIEHGGIYQDHDNASSQIQPDLK